MRAEVESLPSENPNDYCRLCFSDRNLVALHDYDTQRCQYLLDDIFCCTGIKIETDESQPCSICWRCAVAVEDYQLFRKRCVANDVIVRNSCLQSTSTVEHYKDELLVPMPESEHLPNSNDEENADKKLVETIVIKERNSKTNKDKNSKKFGKPNKVISNSTKSKICDLCNHEFASRQSLYAHCKEQHSERGRPFKCNLCDATFKRKSHLEDHVACHTGEIRYTCKDCGVGYAKAIALTRHRRTFHHELPPKRKPANRQPTSTDGKYKCSHCPKTFQHRPSLNFHIKTHYELLKFVCVQCDLRFATKQGMLVHRGRYHLSSVDAQKSLTPTSLESKKKLPCTLCNRVFDQRHYLAQHQKYMHPNDFVGVNEENGELISETPDEANAEATEIAIKFEVEENDFHYVDSENENEFNVL